MITFTGFATRKLTNAEVCRKRCQMFGEEKARQRALVTRIEKIKVEHKGLPDECSLLMNKNLSTPFNCAMRKSKKRLIICFSGTVFKKMMGEGSFLFF